MDSKQDRSDRRQPLGWFGELYRLLAVRRDPEAAGRSAVLNAVIGLLLVAAGLLMSLGDIRAGAVERALVPAIGTLMVLGTVSIARRPGLAFPLLTAQALLLTSFSAIFTLASLRWLLVGSTRSFRYLPGMFLLPWSLGFRELAAFGPWPTRTVFLRRSGVVLGVLSELAFAAVALSRRG